MAEIKGLLFDLDGVIVDTARYHFLAWRKMANDLGIDFTEEQNEELKGVSRRNSILKINYQLAVNEYFLTRALRGFDSSRRESVLDVITSAERACELPGSSDRGVFLG